MPIERFLFTLSPEPEVGYIVDKSPGLNLSDFSFQYVRTRPLGEHVYWLPSEQLIVVQKVEKTYEFPDKPEGMQGREGVWNSAVLCPINEYLRLTRPETLLKQYLTPKGSMERVNQTIRRHHIE